MTTATPAAPAATTPAKAAPAATAAPTAKPAAPKRTPYRLIGGKTFLRDAEGNEVKYVNGDKVLLTAAEAAGRKGQIEPWTEVVTEADE